MPDTSKLFLTHIWEVKSVRFWFAGHFYCARKAERDAAVQAKKEVAAAKPEAAAAPKEEVSAAAAEVSAARRAAAGAEDAADE